MPSLLCRRHQPYLPPPLPPLPQEADIPPGYIVLQPDPLIDLTDHLRFEAAASPTVATPSGSMSLALRRMTRHATQLEASYAALVELLLDNSIAVLDELLSTVNISFD
jgi:hypothetical protein